jgi:hypothetical protein
VYGVIAREVEWLWPQRVPLGKLTILSGDPDLGKTWVMLDIIARVTTGRPFPDAANPFGRKDGTQMGAGFPRRNVLWASAEDDDEDTIKPRLQKLGADASRVESLAFVLGEEFDHKKKEFVETEQTLDLERHLDYLDKWLTGHPLVALVVLDPLAAFVGKIDTHRNSDVRRLLTPLAKLAAKHRVAIVGINHLHKGEGDNALYRGMGSMGFVAAARSSWLVTRDPNEPKDRRLFTKVKGNNASEEVGGLAFRIGPPFGGISWEEGSIEMTADEALRASSSSRAPARTAAKQWLLELLKNGPMPAKEIWELADADGMCRKTVKTAKKELGIGSKREGGANGKVYWSLPK